MKISILEYGVGNLFSIKNSLKKVGITEVLITNSEREINNSDCLVLPGVGNFSIAATTLNTLRDIIIDFLDQGKIIFGICLGLQLFFQESEENQGQGLGLLTGSVKKLPTDVKVPQIGWNNLINKKNVILLENITKDDYFYFVHSYFVQPNDVNVIAGSTNYGTLFPSVISKDNLLGTQFHPEKSSKSGIKILNNLKAILRK